MLPRWALGNWWSQYWPYAQDELISLMADLQAFEIPLSIFVVDMDWHLVDLGEGSDGWTGYAWNHDLFPDPESFFSWMHGPGLKITLYLHSALGVRSHEEQYAEFAKRLGVNPDTGQDIRFDIASVDFAMAYLELLYHPYEEQGVDFWWVDWQQGEKSHMQDLDPLWILNHLRFHDLARNDRTRPMILSRWGGLGSHRYPVGFSGDSHVTWESLAFQPSVTATAANVGYGCWSHDLGGHMRERRISNFSHAGSNMVSLARFSEFIARIIPTLKDVPGLLTLKSLGLSEMLGREDMH
ncbi:MAG: TIM-barrel domain-containing protein [Candidatus Promineifilaceae bacterium]